MLNTIHPLCVAFLLILSAWQHAEATPQAPKIGVVLAFTGEATHWSDMLNKGITLAAEDLRKEGMEFDLVVEDSGSTPAGSVTAFTKLVDVDHVDIVIGNTWGFLTRPLKPLANKKRKLLLSPEPGCTDDGFSFSGGPHLEGMDTAFDDLFQAEPTVRRVAMAVFADPDWGVRNRDAMRRVLKRRNLEEVSSFETLEFKVPFTSVFPGILKKSPDLIFVAHEPVSSLDALQKLRYRGVVVQSSALLEAIVGKTKSFESLEGVYFADTEGDDPFQDRFLARFGTKPYLEAQTGYELLRTALKAWKADPANPAQGMKTVRYTGVAGEVDYTRASCAGNLAAWKMFRVRDGEIRKISGSMGR